MVGLLSVGKRACLNEGNAVAWHTVASCMFLFFSPLNKEPFDMTVYCNDQSERKEQASSVMSL
jgi:hypothetical protein